MNTIVFYPVHELVIDGRVLRFDETEFSVHFDPDIHYSAVRLVAIDRVSQTESLFFDRLDRNARGPGRYGRVDAIKYGIVVVGFSYQEKSGEIEAAASDAWEESYFHDFEEHPMLRNKKIQNDMDTRLWRTRSVKGLRVVEFVS